MKKTVSLLLVLLFTLLLMGSALADAIVYPGTIWSVDYDVWVTTPDGGLNMRDGPGTSYPLIQTIPDYVQLHIDTESSLGWGYTFYNDHWGWVYLGQTSTTPPAGAQAPTGSGVDYYVYVTTPDGGLNMRTGPSTGYALILTIPDYVQLHITQESGGWGYTSYNGSSGWVYLGQTSSSLPEGVTAEPTPSPTPDPTPEPTPAPTPSPAPGEKTETPTEKPADPTAAPADPDTPEPKAPAEEPEETPAEAATTAPENSSPINLRTILLVLLLSVIIVLAAVVIFVVLRKK